MCIRDSIDSENLVKANSLFAIGTYATLPLASLLLGFFSDVETFNIVNEFGNGWSGSIIFLLDAITF